MSWWVWQCVWPGTFHCRACLILHRGCNHWHSRISQNWLRDRHTINAANFKAEFRCYKFALNGNSELFWNKFHSSAITQGIKHWAHSTAQMLQHSNDDSFFFRISSSALLVASNREPHQAFENSFYTFMASDSEPFFYGSDSLPRECTIDAHSWRQLCLFASFPSAWSTD